MRREIRLRTEPTPRESINILSRVESELAARGADVQPRGVGTLLIGIPRFWRLTPKSLRLGPLLFASKGKVTISAGSGRPRRVRYELDFLTLQIVGLLAAIGILSIGLSWHRLTLAGALIAVWVFMNLVPRFLAGRSMHRVVYKSVEPIVDRRQVPREPEPAEAPKPEGLADSQEPAIPPRRPAAEGDSSGSGPGA
jgi:hypothetical protein